MFDTSPEKEAIRKAIVHFENLTEIAATKRAVMEAEVKQAEDDAAQARYELFLLTGVHVAFPPSRY